MIDEHPPIFIKGAGAPKQMLYEKIERTLSQTLPGQAFIIPSELKNTVNTYVKHAYPKEKFAYALTDEKGNYTRVYRIGELKPKK